jgi:hypothetical protein
MDDGVPHGHGRAEFHAKGGGARGGTGCGDSKGTHVAPTGYAQPGGPNPVAELLARSCGAGSEVGPKSGRSTLCPAANVAR